MPLALDKGFAGFTLGVQRVELLLQPFFGGFAGIDRTAQLVPALQRGIAGSAHGAVATAARGRCFRPKKTGPDQCTPVISLATRVKER